MTLIEIVVAMSLLATVITAVGAFVMGTVARNRQLAMEVVGTHTMSRISGQVEDMADSADSDESAAQAILRHVRALGGDTIAIGPNGTSLPRVEDDISGGRLVYRFWVPEPGLPQYAEDDPKFTPNHRALGEMYIYLNERILNDQFLPLFNWTDINPGSTHSMEMDINLDGNIDNSYITNDDDVVQLAISINITFYTDRSHGREAYSVSRHFITSRIKDATGNVDPTG